MPAPVLHRPPGDEAVPAPGLIGIFSSGILGIPLLDEFLIPWGRPVDLRQMRGVEGELAAIAGWGYRPTAERARAEAVRRGVPYLALEDGFLRSIELGVVGAAPWSLVIDDVGVYYDCTRPSRLEGLIAAASDAPCSTAALLQVFRKGNLSKYNAAPDCDPDLLDAEIGGGRTRAGTARPLVIVLDQVLGDMSVASGGAAQRCFTDMLDAALDENPEAQVVVRSHPDVIAGRRQGYLLQAARARQVPIAGRTMNWPSMARRAARVYTATSLGGFEALLHGVPVVCFGNPFYAGWGLTMDRVGQSRRHGRPSLEWVFHAAYETYPRYVDRVHGRGADALTIARRFAQARAELGEQGSAEILGVSARKRPWVRAFVGAAGQRVRFSRPSRRAIARCRRGGGRLLVWAGAEPSWLEPAVRAQRAVLHRIEDGFLRSVGLGSEFIPALSLIVDDLGIYFDPRRESRLERLLAEAAPAPELLAQARELRERLVELRLSKYNVGESRQLAVEDSGAGRRRILVPGQVENDASILRGAPGIRTNLSLLAAVWAAAPDALLLYKPHPDVESGRRPGGVAESELRRLADAVLSGWNAPAAIEAADEVHTMTSLLGFEALLRGRHVVTYGLPFYAGLGLTTDRLAWPRPRPRCSLDMLVAAALLLYPRYRDQRTGLPITAFDAIEILEGLRTAGRRQALSPQPRVGRLRAAANSLVRGLARHPKQMAPIDP